MEIFVGQNNRPCQRKRQLSISFSFFMQPIFTAKISSGWPEDFKNLNGIKTRTKEEQFSLSVPLYRARYGAEERLFSRQCRIGLRRLTITRVAPHRHRSGEVRRISLLTLTHPLLINHQSFSTFITIPKAC